MPQAQTDVIGPQQLSFFHRPSPIAFDPHRCRRVHEPLPLNGHGLVAGTTITTHFVGKFTATARPRGVFVFRVRATVKNGSPTRVLFAVATSPAGPSRFFDWSPTRIASALRGPLYHVPGLTAYILRRLALTVGVLIAVSYLTFVVVATQFSATCFSQYTPTGAFPPLAGSIGEASRLYLDWLKGIPTGESFGNVCGAKITQNLTQALGPPARSSR